MKFRTLGLITAMLIAGGPMALGAGNPRTTVSIEGHRWLINGKITYPGAPAEGLLLNVRMVNAVFEDTKRPEFNPEENLQEFLSQIPDYMSHGILAFTLCLQGGDPGYEGAVNSAYEPDGTLRPEYLQRVLQVIEACDRQGAVVILGCYYQRQDQLLKDDDAVRAGVVNTAAWVRDQGFRNVLLEVANEFPHPGFQRQVIRKPNEMAGLIQLARETAPELLVTASGYGKGLLPDEVCEVSDFLLPHMNATPVDQISIRMEVLKKYGKPVVCNEDDKLGEHGAQAARESVRCGISWGLMLSKHNQHFPFAFNGAADDPVIYATLKELATPIPGSDDNR